MTVKRCGSFSRFSRRLGRSGSRPSASRMVWENLTGSAVSRHKRGTPGWRCSRATFTPSAVRAAAGDEFAVRARQVEFPPAVEAAVEVPHARAVAADEVEHVALEVRRLRDVHRRAGGFLHVLSHTVTAGAEELVEHIVLVAR